MRTFGESRDATVGLVTLHSWSRGCLLCCGSLHVAHQPSRARGVDLVAASAE